MMRLSVSYFYLCHGRMCENCCHYAADYHQWNAEFGSRITEYILLDLSIIHRHFFPVHPHRRQSELSIQQPWRASINQFVTSFLFVSCALALFPKFSIDKSKMGLRGLERWTWMTTTPRLACLQLPTTDRSDTIKIACQSQEKYYCIMRYRKITNERQRKSNKIISRQRQRIRQYIPTNQQKKNQCWICGDLTFWRYRQRHSSVSQEFNLLRLWRAINRNEKNNTKTNKNRSTPTPITIRPPLRLCHLDYYTVAVCIPSFQN